MNLATLAILKQTVTLDIVFTSLPDNGTYAITMIIKTSLLMVETVETLKETFMHFQEIRTMIIL